MARASRMARSKLPSVKDLDARDAVFERFLGLHLASVDRANDGQAGDHVVAPRETHSPPGGKGAGQ
jgi:hypothetical protein